MRNSRKRRLRYTNEASMLCLSLLSAVSAIITCVAAVRGYPRLGWLVCITLLLLFLSAVNRLRIPCGDQDAEKRARGAQGIPAGQGEDRGISGQGKRPRQVIPT